MIRRPLHVQFNDEVLEERKITTIRREPWPLGVPIMLYNWAGVAYRSNQINVATVEVIEERPITIEVPVFSEIYFSISRVAGRPLWACEGFRDRDSMDSWFYREVKLGTSEVRHLMQFRLLERVLTKTS